jgi:hypothetical protein
MGNILARNPLTSTAFPTDKEIAQEIAEIYKRNACWTWYDDYAWPDTESFVVDQEPSQGTQHYGDGMSLNFIKIEPPAKPSSPLRRRLTRLRARLRIRVA